VQKTEKREKQHFRLCLAPPKSQKVKRLTKHSKCACFLSSYSRHPKKPGFLLFFDVFIKKNLRSVALEIEVLCLAPLKLNKLKNRSKWAKKVFNFSSKIIKNRSKIDQKSIKNSIFYWKCNKYFNKILKII
jgi:hypothetical protein